MRDAPLFEEEPPDDARPLDDLRGLEDFFEPDDADDLRLDELVPEDPAPRLDDFELRPARFVELFDDLDDAALLRLAPPLLRAVEPPAFFELALLREDLEAADDRFAVLFFDPPFFDPLFFAPPLLFLEADDFDDFLLPPDFFAPPDFLLPDLLPPDLLPPLDLDDFFADFLAAIGVLLFKTCRLGSRTFLRSEIKLHGNLVAQNNVDEHVENVTRHPAPALVSLRRRNHLRRHQHSLPLHLHVRPSHPS